MLQLKRTKHRKAQKGRIRQVAKRGATIAFGSFALKATGANLDDQQADRSSKTGAYP